MSDKRDQLLLTTGLAFLFGLTTGVTLSSMAGFILRVLRPRDTSRRELPAISPGVGVPPVRRVVGAIDTVGTSLLTREPAIIRLERTLTISPAKMHEIVKHFVKEMQRGLAAEGQTLKMIPSYVIRRATGNETGVYLALDLGGSNFRVCEVFLDGRGQVRMKQKKYVVSDTLKTGEGEALFDFFASSIKEFYEENGIQKDSFRRLGFTFSFPCSQTSIDKGYLIQWTKGFTAKGVEGKDIAKMLQEALKRQNLQIHVSAIVNDTVGALISHSYVDPSTFIGVILGTGSNAAYVERIGQIPKWKAAPPSTGEMVINMEWGAFDNEGVVLPSTPYDAKLDRESAHPREQRFEKMISGMYLGEITRLVMADLISTGELFAGRTSTLLETPYSFETANMSRIERYPLHYLFSKGPHGPHSY
jgi:hexokinase